MRILKFFAIAGLIILSSFSSCGSAEKKEIEYSAPVGSMKLEYASQFSVDYYENDISLINIADGEKYLLVPEKTDIPDNIPDDITIIKQPVKKIYMAASSAVDLIHEIDSLDCISAVSTSQKDWSLEYMK